MSKSPRTQLGVLVWDLPTRVFHWALVILVAAAWLTGEGEGWQFVLHTYFGYGILTALLFRLAWGFIGSRHARFNDFVYAWPAVRDHAKRLLLMRPRPFLGHNPLGGWMIVLLLVALAGIVGTGLFGAEDEVSGPLAHMLPRDAAHALAELHESLTSILLVLIAVHVAGIVVETALTRDNLVHAMITGRKTVEAKPATNVAAPVPIWRAVASLVLAAGLTWLLVLR